MPATPATLAPMRPQRYADWVEASVRGYAELNVASGRWPSDGAVERSRAEFERLLPLGLATPDQHICEIWSADGTQAVGALWIALQRHPAGVGAYVFDIEVLPEHRRQGHARRAFIAMEPFAVAFGATSIGLHVHAHNTGARALYESLGYGVTGVNMHKALRPTVRTG
ncbi:ribosomal protein S18 acetylase RimI-like enzyme [Rhizobacter sp. SG703]|nr:ribosomal protein S18 acetylase RimI-like enzyme [Rhizobacter sp. SG703]